MIGNGGESLIIPFDENARGLIHDLKHVGFQGKILRRCQRYIVQVHPWEMKQLEAVGSVERIDGIYPVLRQEFFDTCYLPETGVYVDVEVSWAPASLIF